MKKIHIIPHSHWDREWYFTTEMSQVLLYYFMDEVFASLEAEEFPYFVLDGQAVILDDYLQFRPEKAEQIGELVRKGKLIIGPWYTQTDEMVVSAESITRNLLYGIRRCEDFGPWMHVGYLPDSFGQSAQMPQILNGFDIRSAIFWRGVHDDLTDRTEFLWTTANGNEVLAITLPLGYSIGKYLPHDPEAALMRVQSIAERLGKQSTSNNILIPNGHDQMPIQKDLPDLVKAMNEMDAENEYVISNYENIIADIRQAGGHLERIGGELIYPQHSRIHRSIYSTRMDLKQLNSRIETLVSGYLEPILSMAYQLGQDYPHAIIEHVWKELFKNQAHDSIGCCNTDEVHDEIKARYQHAQNIAESLLQLNMRKLADGIATGDEPYPLILFNTLPYARTASFTQTVLVAEGDFVIADRHGKLLDFDILDVEAIDLGTIDRRIASRNETAIVNKYTLRIQAPTIGGIGYEVVYLRLTNTTSQHSVTTRESAIENDTFRLMVEENGSISLFDKRNESFYADLISFEDGSDDGDEYNYSPLLEDWLISSHTTSDYSSYKGQLEQALDLQYCLKIPANIMERQARIASHSLTVKVRLSLIQGESTIQVKVKLKNESCDHRLRLILNTSLHSEYSWADIQFGSIERRNKPSELAQWEREHWVEKPVGIYPLLTYAEVHQGAKRFALISNDVKEYEVLGGDNTQMAITLFRSIGYLGKADLVNRPGRASGVGLPTADSQMQGEYEWTLFIYPHLEHDELTAKIAKERITPLIGYQKTDYTVFVTNPSTRNFSDSYQMLQVEGPVIMSALKKAEDDAHLILRLFNPQMNQPGWSAIDVFGETVLLECVSLAEKPEKTIDSGEIEFGFGEVKSFKF